MLMYFYIFVMYVYNNQLKVCCFVLCCIVLCWGTACEVDFESKNYTDLTRQCKGPKYPAKECCAAFKQFACPYAHQINDLTTDCARIMFSYITVHGKYPPGLFATECRETKEGLVCPSSPPRVSAAPHHITLVVSAATALLAFLVLA